MVCKQRHALRLRLGIGLASLVVSGCAFVPKSRLDDCVKLTQALRSENAQLKDSTLSLKGENADLSRRALDDERRLSALEGANDRLESSVQAYIDEREGLNDAFQRFRRQAQASASPPSTALISRLRTFVADHPGTTIEPGSGRVAIEADRLFVPGTDRLRPEAGAWLDGLAAILAEPEARSRSTVVAASPGDPGVVRASATGAAGGGDSASLPLARAVRLRDALAERAGRDPNRIGVAGRASPRGGEVEAASGRDPVSARIEVDLDPPTP